MADSVFNTKYYEIISIIQSDFEKLDCEIASYFEKQKTNNTQIIPIIKEFINNKGKRVRPALIFLLAKALNKKENDFYVKIAMANELLHNATLIHDDIIDCSLLRRGQKTLNFDYDSKLAVLAGDFLIAQVLNLLFDIEDKNIRETHSQAVSNLINGELYQYFNRYKLLSIDKYIEKSKDKTARLFEAGLVSTYTYDNQDIKNKEEVKNFALNFGTAFQIINDIENFNDTQKVDEDIQNGDYSAPFIYYVQEKYQGDLTKIKNVKLISKHIKNSDAIEKSEQLAKYYLNRAIENTSFLEDNQYKRAIIDLCNLLSGKRKE